MRPYWQDLTLNLAGPVFATLVGTAILGLVAQRIAQGTQDAREIQKLRDEFVRDATNAAVGLYVATQRYWRAAQSHRDQRTTDEELAEERALLDIAYRESRVAGEILECRFYAYFDDDAPRRLMHQVMDLLTVRYFQLIGLDTPGLLEANAGAAHSGLTVEQLHKPKEVLDTYRATLLTTVESVVTTPLSIRGRHTDSTA
jgi:hypothetical protein